MKPGPWFKIRALPFDGSNGHWKPEAARKIPVGKVHFNFNGSPYHLGEFEIQPLTIPDTELELLRTENRQLRHELNQMSCRAETAFKFIRDCNVLLNSNPSEVLADIQERLPFVKKLLRKAQKRDPL